jgi:hypothetical protein
VLILAFFTSQPGNGIWVLFYLVYPKMYPNSLLVSLNSRGQVRAPLQNSGAVHSASSGRAGVTVRFFKRDFRAPIYLDGQLDPERGQTVQLDVLHAVPKAGYAFEDYK